MFKSLANCTFKIKLELNKPVAIKNVAFTLRWCNTPSNDNLTEWAKIKVKFTDKQLTRVLKVLNKCDLNEMRKSGISEHDIEVLERLPTKKIHKSLDDFLGYDVITVHQLENICSNIARSKKTNSSKVSSPVSPPIKKEIIQNLNTVIGLRIGPNYVSWSQLELTGSNCNILKWDCQSITELPLNVNNTEIIKAGISITKDIPYANAYVMEKDSSKPKSHINSSMLRLLFRQQQLISTIITLLFTRRELNGSNNDPSNTFYTMRSFAPAQLFGLFLGNEHVDASKVVQAILDKEYNGLNNIGQVTVDYDTISRYTAQNSLIKEEMNKSLLLTLTFFELAVLGKVMNE